MPTVNAKNLSAFAQAALCLDGEFNELERLSAALERLSVDSEGGLERAQQLMSSFSESGERLADGIKMLGKTLDEARVRAEHSAKIVSERAAIIQERQLQTDRLLERFKALGDMAKQITAAVGKLHKPVGGQLGEEEKELLTKHLPQLDSQLQVLTDEARKLKDEAHEANLKNLERNADSMGQSLYSVRARLKSLADPPGVPKREVARA